MTLIWYISFHFSKKIHKITYGFEGVTLVLSFNAYDMMYPELFHIIPHAGSTILDKKISINLMNNVLHKSENVVMNQSSKPSLHRRIL